MIRLACLVALILATSAHAQVTTYGAAPYPSPAPRTFIDQATAQCVIAVPCPFGDSCVLLKPCPPGTLVPPPASPLPAPVAPPVVSAPIAPTAEPKSVEPKEPVIIRIEVVPVAPATPAPKAAPKAAPKKKECPC